MKSGLDQMQESARKGELELLYFDESGFSCLPNVQRSWSPLAHPHTADASLGRKRANVIGTLNYVTQHLDFQVYDHSVCRANVISFLDGLATASNPELVTFVIMDNASIHLNIDPEITDRWLLQNRFVTLFLPAYSPELNLIEILWKHAKFHWRGFTSWTKDTLIPEVTNLLSSFGSKFHINYT